MTRVGFQRVRQRDGVTEVLITRRMEYDDQDSIEEHALFNVRSRPGLVVQEGETYWAEFQSVRPRLVDSIMPRLTSLLGIFSGWRYQ